MNKNPHKLTSRTEKNLTKELYAWENLTLLSWEFWWDFKNLISYMGNTSPWELLTQDFLSMKHCVLSPLFVPNFISQEPRICMNMLCTTPSSSIMYSHSCKPQNVRHEEACYKKLWQHSQAENVLLHHHVSCTCHRHEFLLVVMNSDHLKFRNERSNKEKI